MPIVMRAISLWQPWASLWLTDRKIHETRHWPTKHRGWLIVHAAKRFEKDFEPGEPMGDILDAEFGNHWGQDLPTGAILGAVELAACISTNTLAWAHDDDLETGNWGPDRFAWKRARSVKLNVPIPYKGRQGLFDIPADDIVPLLDLIPADPVSVLKCAPA